MKKSSSDELLNELSKLIIGIARKEGYFPTEPTQIPPQIFDRSIEAADLALKAASRKDEYKSPTDMFVKLLKDGFLLGVDDTYHRLRGDFSGSFNPIHTDVFSPVEFEMTNTHASMAFMYRKSPMPIFIFNEGFKWFQDNQSRMESAGGSSSDCLVWLVHLSYITGTYRAERALGAFSKFVASQ